MDGPYQQALALHREGRLAEAETAYEAIVRASPGDANSLHLLGLIAAQTDRLDRAIELISRAVRFNPRHVEAHNNLGNVLKMSGRLKEALASYDRAIALSPQYAEALSNRGNALLAQQRFEEALSSYDRALAARPAYPEALCHRGMALQALGKAQEALAGYDHAIALRPDFPEAHISRGDLLHEYGRSAEAVESYDRAIALRPDYAEALNNRGNALVAAGRPAEAVASLDAALALDPGYAEAHANRANALLELKRADEALAACEAALALRPDFAEALIDQGNALTVLGRLEDAVASYDRAVALKPGLAEAYDSRGNGLRRLKRFDEALASYERALALKPKLANAAYGKSMVELLLGDWEQGFADYEARTRKTSILRPGIEQPRLRSIAEASGKTVFVSWEQGFGDTLQFCRYLKPLADAGAHVVFSAQDRLLGLLAGLSPPAELIGRDAAPEAFDLYTPLMSLPLVFGTTPKTVPADVPYLCAEPARVSAWRERLGGHGFRIGVAWQGVQEGREHADRAFALRDLKGLARLPGVRLISLQKGDGEDQLASLPKGMKVERLGDDFDSGPDAFVDTAAVMQCLDLVISPDMSIAHLAGALGRPAWVGLLPVPDWRWGLEGERTPWYPTLRLFRQTQPGDWRSVFDEMERGLLTLLGE